jgi:hypothetical protein
MGSFTPSIRCSGPSNEPTVRVNGIQPFTRAPSASAWDTLICLNRRTDTLSSFFQSLFKTLFQGVGRRRILKKRVFQSWGTFPSCQTLFSLEWNLGFPGVQKPSATRAATFTLRPLPRLLIRVRGFVGAEACGSKHHRGTDTWDSIKPARGKVNAARRPMRGPAHAARGPGSGAG